MDTKRSRSRERNSSRSPMNHLKSAERNLKGIIDEILIEKSTVKKKKSKRDKQIQKELEEKNFEDQNFNFKKTPKEEIVEDEGEEHSLDDIDPITEFQNQDMEDEKNDLETRKRVILQPAITNSAVKKRPKLEPVSVTKSKPMGLDFKFAENDKSISYKYTTESHHSKKQPVVHEFEPLNVVQGPIQNKEEKYTLLFKLRQDLKKIMRNSEKLEEREPIDEVLELQIRQIEDKIVKFKGEYLVEDDFDKKLQEKVIKYENKIERARTLLDQSALFDSKSKKPFLRGVSGLVKSSTDDFLGDLKEAREEIEEDIEMEEKDELISVKSSKKSIRLHPPEFENSELKIGKSVEDKAPQNSHISNYETPKHSYEEHKPTNSNGYNRISLVEPDHSQTEETYRRTPSSSNRKGILKNPPESNEVETEHVINSTEIINLEQSEGMITALKLIQDSYIAIAFSTGLLTLFNITENSFIWSSKEHKGPISAMEVANITLDSTQGIQSKKVLLTGGSEEECSILVWDIETSQLLKKLSGHSHLISSIIDLNDNSSIATGSFDSKIAIWDLSDSFNCIQLLEESSSPILSLDFSKEDQILCAGSLHGGVQIYKVFYNEENGLYHGCAVIQKLNMDGHIIEATRFTAFPDFLISLQSDFEVKIHSIKSARLMRSFKGPNPFVDFVLVEKLENGPILFCVDNMNNILKYQNWPVDGVKLLLEELVKNRIWKMPK